jgi:hypothetical protein
VGSALDQILSLRRLLAPPQILVRLLESARLQHRCDTAANVRKLVNAHDDIRILQRWTKLVWSNPIVYKMINENALQFTVNMVGHLGEAQVNLNGQPKV